jgi:hypothetical protein
VLLWHAHSAISTYQITTRFAYVGVRSGRHDMADNHRQLHRTCRCTLLRAAVLSGWRRRSFGSTLVRSSSLTCLQHGLYLSGLNPAPVSRHPTILHEVHAEVRKQKGFYICRNWDGTQIVTADACTRGRHITMLVLLVICGSQSSGLPMSLSMAHRAHASMLCSTG